MSESRTVFVECTYTIPVTFPAHWTDEMIRFEVETNGCPGTGFTGAAFAAHFKEQTENNMCWACTLNGDNRIVDGLSEIKAQVDESQSNDRTPAKWKRPPE